jgi:hypothetical protein
MSAQPWRFSAAESLLLQRDAEVSGAEVLKVALAELVAGGQLRVEPGRKPRLVRGAARLGRAGRSVRALLDVFERTGVGRAGLEVAKLAAAVRARYGSLDGYRDQVVLAGLVEDGLFAAETRRVLWLFPARRHVLTFAGQSAQRRLGELHEELRADPAAAVPAAGAAVLLLPALFPELRELERARRTGGSDGGASWSAGVPYSDGGAAAPEGDLAPAPWPAATPSAEPTSTPVATLDLPSFDFTALDAIGGFDAAVSAIDAGVGDGGGSSDGGGGDGGGGGGDGGSSS